jgi:hypothetical protein
MPWLEVPLLIQCDLNNEEEPSVNTNNLLGQCFQERSKKHHPPSPQKWGCKKAVQGNL